MISPDSVTLWPNGSWCYWHEIDEFTHMSDDYKIICEGTEEYRDFLNLVEAATNWPES